MRGTARRSGHGPSFLCNGRSSPGVTDLTGKESKKQIPINELHTNENYLKII